MSPEFRVMERDLAVRMVCTECGEPAQGNCSWTDGSGEICDACVAAEARAAADACVHVGGYCEECVPDYDRNMP